MKHVVYFLLFLSSIVYGQVGINTSSPQGALDITSDNLGLVLPRVTSLEDVTNNQAGLAEDGTIVYDVSRAKTCFRVANVWICIANDGTVAVTTTSLVDPNAEKSTQPKKKEDQPETRNEMAVLEKEQH
ncbi:MAG TPA: hypothetical protein PKW08_06390 [Flavobacteriaceae bacterium]|nr:hypothetical protein [Flavobacteriaceae bacterium]HPF11135.1 hypothetical protein [Flavobacteriaceae bacterium]HQU21197.1 hypothetical protein [Flavobacteriaceae bacterium]HQU65669.1 hypothetical protein [Flavobacteriaceae bacterium]HRW43744.1 hypothetical protein [Flavobacteriaceae bacterium]